MIAASIVFVSLENIFCPQRSRRGTRLVIAFGFGLFHGLGFAGGLVGAMQEIPENGIAMAIPSFGLGVELGHLAVIVPLFGMLCLGRACCTGPSMRDEFSARALKYGSVPITIMGLYFLITAAIAYPR